MTPRPGGLVPLLVDLGRAGVELSPLGHAGTARLRHRPACLPPGLSARLRLHRDAVAALLADEPAAGAAARDGAGYVLAERLGVAEDLGMPTHPGSPAWLVAAGEALADGCDLATNAVHSAHGPADGGDRGGGAGERPEPLRDRQGRGRGP